MPQHLDLVVQGTELQTLLAQHAKRCSRRVVEIGLHGLDAWHDEAKGKEELEEIRRITEGSTIGVRMHWLYFDQNSPLMLDRAGADYDSTIGYNDAIGYRAGTTQAYKPLGVERLMELPLHIMDTALFYPKRMALSPGEANKRVATVINNAVRYGGAVTVNWHDRSIAPERCWRDFYLNMVGELRTNRAWFATAAEAVAWFRARRSTAFDNVARGERPVSRVIKTVEGLPDLKIQVHGRRERPVGAGTGSRKDTFSAEDRIRREMYAVG